MELIDSFQVHHINMKPGLYVSRVDDINGAKVVTYDLRFTAPNRQPVMDTGPIHTIEHIGATYLRNSNIADKVVYFGPMGCRTGFYLIVSDELSYDEVLDVVKDMLVEIIQFDGDKVPGADPDQCGNYLDQNIPMAKYYSNELLRQIVDRDNHDGHYEYYEE